MQASSWWNFEAAPSPDEWQAMLMLLTLGAAVWAGVAAYRQLHEMRKSNAVSASAVEESSRPQVYLEIEFDGAMEGHPGIDKGATAVLLTITNFGRSAARNIRLVSDPPLLTSGMLQLEGRDSTADSWLKELCAGKKGIAYLPSGKSQSFVLDDARGIFGPDTQVPRRYSFLISYDALTSGRYEDSQTIDFDVIGYSAVKVDPLERIASSVDLLLEP